MIIGINTSKTAIYFAECQTNDEGFSVQRIVKFPFKLTKSEDLANLLSSVKTLLVQPSNGGSTSVAILKCIAGLRASSIEAVKAEAVIQLAAVQQGIQVAEVSSGSFKRLFSCMGSGQKWQPAARELLDPGNTLSYWTEGGCGAAAAAYKLATK